LVCSRHATNPSILCMVFYCDTNLRNLNVKTTDRNVRVVRVFLSQQKERQRSIFSPGSTIILWISNTCVLYRRRMKLVEDFKWLDRKTVSLVMMHSNKYCVVIVYRNTKSLFKTSGFWCFKELILSNEKELLQYIVSLQQDGHFVMTYSFVICVKFERTF